MVSEREYYVFRMPFARLTQLLMLVNSELHCYKAGESLHDVNDIGFGV